MEESEEMSTRKYLCIEKRFLVPKIYYFFYFMAIGSIIPFFAIYFEYRGLSDQQIGILNSIQPFIFFLSSSLWTITADKFERHKEILLITQIIGCSSICLLLVPIDSFFSEDHSNGITFTYFLIIILIYAIIQSSGSPLLDGVTLMYITPQSDLYGRQRVWGAIGWGLGAIISGMITTFANPNWMFLSFGIFAIFFLIFITIFLNAKEVYRYYKTQKSKIDHNNNGERNAINNSSENKSKVKFASKLFLLLTTIRFLNFLVFSFIYGVLQGMLLYVPLYLEDDFGAKEILIGLCIVMSVSLEIPMFFLSDKLLSKFNSRSLISISIFAIIIRYFGYTILPYLPSVWFVLLIEPLHGISFGFFFISAVKYVNDIAPPGLAATGQGLYSASFNGVGRGVGSILGGILYYHLGGQLLFLCSSISGFGLLIYFLATHRMNPKKDDVIAIEM